jgi:hypothetical protein
MSTSLSQSINPNQIFGKYSSYFSPITRFPYERLKQISSDIPIIIQPSTEKNHPNRFVVIFRANEMPYIKIVDYIQNRGFFFDKTENGYLNQCPTFEDFIKKYEISFPIKKEFAPEESKKVDSLISRKAELLKIENSFLSQHLKQSITKVDWDFLKKNPKEFYCMRTYREDYPLALIFIDKASFDEPKSISFRYMQEGVQTSTTFHNTLKEFLDAYNLNTKIL